MGRQAGRTPSRAVAGGPGWARWWLVVPHLPVDKLGGTTGKGPFRSYYEVHSAFINANLVQVHNNLIIILILQKQSVIISHKKNGR